MTADAAPLLAHPALVPLAQDLNENKVTPGLLGFVVFAVIALALWGLMKNMGKQMKKIDFEEKPADKGRPPAARAADKGRPPAARAAEERRPSPAAKAADPKS